MAFSWGGGLLKPIEIPCLESRGTGIGRVICLFLNPCVVRLRKSICEPDDPRSHDEERNRSG